MPNWNEVLDDINSTKPLDEDAEERTEDNPETPEVEESPDPDKVPEDPEGDEAEPSEQDEDDEPAEAEEESEESEPEEQPAEEPEAEAEDDDPDDPWITIQGQKVRQSEVLKWRDQGLMREDYTRKTQQLSERQRQLQDSSRQMQTLATDIAKDPTIQRFLSANPEAIQYLMADPQATRQLIGNPEGVKQFWREYNVLKENPQIAERLYKSENPQEKPPEMVEAERQQHAVAVANSLNHVIEAVGREYPEVDDTEVADYLLGLVGLTADTLPKEPQLARQALYGGLARLQQMLFHSDGQTVYVDPTLIKDRFETLNTLRTTKEQREQKKAEAHNEKIDRALREKGGPPASPKGGSPMAQKEKPRPYTSLQDALEDIAR